MKKTLSVILTPIYLTVFAFLLVAFPGKYIEGMFFCHLCIEKIIKALVVKQIETIPPKSHDLFYLANLAKIQITEEQSDFMQILKKYQLEGRYPEYYPKAPSFDKMNEYLYQSNNLFQCFNKML